MRHGRNTAIRFGKYLWWINVGWPKIGCTYPKQLRDDANHKSNVNFHIDELMRQRSPTKSVTIKDLEECLEILTDLISRSGDKGELAFLAMGYGHARGWKPKTLASRN